MQQDMNPYLKQLQQKVAKNIKQEFRVLLPEEQLSRHFQTLQRQLMYTQKLIKRAENKMLRQLKIPFMIIKAIRRIHEPKQKNLNPLQDLQLGKNNSGKSYLLDANAYLLKLKKEVEKEINKSEKQLSRHFQTLLTQLLVTKQVIKCVTDEQLRQLEIPSGIIVAIRLIHEQKLKQSKQLGNNNQENSQVAQQHSSYFYGIFQKKQNQQQQVSQQPSSQTWPSQQRKNDIKMNKARTS